MHTVDDDGFWRCRSCGLPQGEVFRVCLECGAARPARQREGGLAASLAWVAAAIALVWIVMAALPQG